MADASLYESHARLAALATARRQDPWDQPHPLVVSLWNRYFPGWYALAQKGVPLALRPFYRVRCSDMDDYSMAQAVTPEFLRVEVLYEPDPSISTPRGSR